MGIYKHRRSTGSAAPATIERGEITFTQGSVTLYIGDATADNTPIAIGPAIINDNGTPGFAGAITAAQIRSLISVDSAGTDNSTPVTVVESVDYVSLSGQQLTFNNITPSSFSDFTADVRAQISQGTGVTISNGEISIGQDVSTSANPTFNNLILTGDLDITGSINRTPVDQLTVEDNAIILNSTYAGSSPTLDATIEVERGTVANSALRWNESTNRWQFTNDGTTWNNMPIPAEYGAGAGSVTSVDATVPTGLQVTGGPITGSGVLAITFQSGYSIPTNTKQGEWDTAFGWGDWSSGVDKAFVDALGINATQLQGNSASAFATSAQGATADTALQSITLSSTDGSITGVGASSGTTPSFDLEVGVIDGGTY